MPKTSDRSEVPAAIQTHITAIFISLELSRKVWLVTSLSPGAGEKMSKHCVPAGDVAALLLRFAELKRKAQARTGELLPDRHHPGGGTRRLLAASPAGERRRREPRG